MNSKRLLTLVVASAMIFGAAVPVYADTANGIKGQVITASDVQQNMKVSKEDAKNIALKLLSDSFSTKLDEKKFSSRIELRTSNDITGKGYVWDLNWYYYNEGSNKSIDISIDADTGKLLSVNIYEYISGSQNLASITKEQAKKIAGDFAKKMNPGEFSNTKLVDTSAQSNYYERTGSDYNFYYERLINGIPFRDNGLSVTVNGITGKVTGYSIRWSDKVSAPASDGVIAISKANDIYRNNYDFKLNYRQYYDNFSGNNSQIYKLVYVPDGTGVPTIDAKTGSVLNENSGSQISFIDLTEKEKADFLSKYKEVTKLDKEIDKNKAQEDMLKIVHDLYGDGYRLEGLSYQESSDKNIMLANNTWSAQFIKGQENDANTQRGSISIDATTEGLVDIENYSYMDKTDDNNFTPCMDYEAAYKKAIDYTALYFSDKVKEINTRNIKYVNSKDGKEIQSRYQYFTFLRTVNGIDYDTNNINVQIDMKTGGVNRIGCYWSNDVNVPEPKNIISAKDAEDIFFENNKPALYYIAYNKSSDYNNPDYEIKLVYSIYGINNYMDDSIDAFTGKRLTPDGKEIDDNIDEFMKNIKGSPYEKELTILAYGGILETKGFNPKKQITKMDLIKMLVNAKGYKPYLLDSAADLKFSGSVKGDANYKYLQMAVAYGLMENKEGTFNPDEKETREDIIKSIVKFMGYDKIAKCTGIYTVNYKDAKEILSGNIGYIAIAKGLGIIDAKVVNFGPKQVGTMEETAAYLYRALTDLKN